MTRNEKILKCSFLFENLPIDLQNSATMITNELKENSLLDQDKIVNILLDFLNRGSTSNKLMSPCAICGDSDVKCFACDQLIEEIEKYRK